jgi:hypothetical protein
MKLQEQRWVHLGQKCWSESYNLSLHILKNAASAQSAQGNTDLILQQLNEVIVNAQSLEDMLEPIQIIIHFFIWSHQRNIDSNDERRTRIIANHPQGK